MQHFSENQKAIVFSGHKWDLYIIIILCLFPLHCASITSLSSWIMFSIKSLKHLRRDLMQITLKLFHKGNKRSITNVILWGHSQMRYRNHKKIQQRKSQTNLSHEHAWKKILNEILANRIPRTPSKRSPLMIKCGTTQRWKDSAAYENLSI